MIQILNTTWSFMGRYWYRRWVRPCQSLKSEATAGGRTISPKVAPPVLKTGDPVKAVKARTGSKCWHASCAFLKSDHHDHRHPVYEAGVRTDTDKDKQEVIHKGAPTKRRNLGEKREEESSEAL